MKTAGMPLAQTCTPGGLKKRIEAMNRLLQHLSNGLPDQSEDIRMADILTRKLQQRIETLETRLESIRAGGRYDRQRHLPGPDRDGPVPGGYHRHLPQNQDVEDKLGRELTVEDLIAGVANIVPPPDEQSTIQADIMAVLLRHAQEKSNLAAADKALPPGTGSDGTILSSGLPGRHTAAQLNSLVVGDHASGYDGSPTDHLLDKKVMKGLDLIQKLSERSATGQAQGQKSGHILKTGFSSLLQSHDLPSDIEIPKGWYQTFFNGGDWSSPDIQSGLPLSQITQAVHTATAVQQAGQPHPATHLVAATLTKAAKSGEAKALTIQMDPPELGRVDVRLEFGTDNTVKAHMIAEKPETFLMLQRDAAVLERALQDAGLDADGSNLSFELAEDGSAFEQNNNGNGNGSSGGGSEDQTDMDEDILHTTMTWQIDPETGHMHYDILA